MDATGLKTSARRARRVFLLLLGAAALAVVAFATTDRARPADAAGCDGTIAYGEVVGCSIASSGAIQSQTFPGTNGHVVRVRVIPTGGTLNPIAEIRKGAASVCGATFADEFSCALTSNGTFTLLVKDASTGTGTFSATIQDLNAPVGCSSVPFNPTGVTATISAVSEMDCFTRAGGAVGQTWRVRVVETSGTLFANVDIIRPDGTTLCTTTAIEGGCLLDQAGTYTILVRDTAGANTGDYRLEFQKFPNPTGCTALTFNTPVAAAFTDPGTIQCFTFSGSGQPAVRVRAIPTAGAINPVTEGFRPDGTSVCPNTFADEITCQLDTAGTHTLYVRDANGPNLGSVTVVVQNLVAPVGCANVPFNTTGITASISVGGEMDCFTRAGTVGQTWRERLVETSGSLFANVDIVRPNGTTLCTTTAIEGSCTLDVAGTYTILVRDTAGTNTGNYRIELQKFPKPAGCTKLTFNTPVNATFNQAGAIECFTFSGKKKPNVRIRAIPTAGAINPVSEGFRPDGSSLCPNTFADEFSCQLDDSGTHTLYVRDANGPNVGTVAVVVQNLNQPVGCVSVPFNATGITATISAGAEMDCFTATGSVGQVWRPRVVETSGTLFANVDVIRPDGTTVCTTTAIEGSCTLADAGTHTVLVRDTAGTNTGNYRIELQKFPKPAGCTALTFNTPVDVTINQAGALSCFTFSGSGQPNVRIRAIPTAGAINPVTEVFRPAGTSLCPNTFADEINCQLDAGGTHTVLVRDANGPNTGSVSVVVQNLVAPVGCVNVPFNTTGITASISAPAEMDCFTANGSVGQVWRPRVVETSGTLFANIDVIRPDGTTLCTTTAIEGSCTLDQAGTHTILVRDTAGTNTGNYRIELEKFPSPSGCVALTFGVQATATITQPGALQCFTFSGAGKPNVRIRVIPTSGAVNPVTEGFRPDGTSLCPNTFADDFNCQLDVTGTHTIFVRDANGPNTGTASVQVDKL